MNIERLETLRDTLIDVAMTAPKEFNYRFFFSQDGEASTNRAADLIEVPLPHCGTAGCVAGWALMLFRPGLEVTPRYCTADPRSAFQRAADLLELDTPQACFLFLQDCDMASVADAIKRINWLLSGEQTGNYPLSQESWWKPRMDAKLRALDNEK